MMGLADGDLEAPPDRRWLHPVRNTQPREELESPKNGGSPQGKSSPLQRFIDGFRGSMRPGARKVLQYATPRTGQPETAASEQGGELMFADRSGCGHIDIAVSIIAKKHEGGPSEWLRDYDGNNRVKGVFHPDRENQAEFESRPEP